MNYSRVGQEAHQIYYSSQVCDLWFYNNRSRILAGEKYLAGF